MVRTLLILILFAAEALAQTATASIQGSVTDAQNNRPVAGAHVTAIRSELPPARQTARTGSDGVFQLSGLPAGTYTICAQVPGSLYLDPCKWTAGPANPLAKPAGLVLAAGQKVTGAAVRLAQGSALTVRLEDPGQVLSQKTKDGRVPHVAAGVWGTNNLFHPAAPSSADKNGVTYTLAIPKDTPLRFQIVSRDLKLSDSAGAALAANAPAESFQHATTDANPKSYRFTVTGLAP